MTDVEKLEEKAGAIKEKLAPLRDQSKKIMDTRKERDELNQKVKDQNELIKTLKIERDKYTKKVQAAKKKRDELNKQIAEKKKIFSQNFPPKKEEKRMIPYENLKKQADDMRWSIETSGADFKTEKKLRGKLEKLDEELATRKKEEDARSEIQQLEKQARLHHQTVLENSAKSEEVHQKIKPLQEETKKTRKTADQKHKAVVKTMEARKELEQELQPAYSELDNVRNQIKDTQDNVRKAKKKKESATKKEIVDSAEKKLKAGKRVDLRELQLKYELEDGKS